MADVGAHLVVLGIFWAMIIGGGGTLLIRNHWGLVAGSSGAVMVFIGTVLLGLAQASG
jgi:hypothetical protein